MSTTTCLSTAEAVRVAARRAAVTCSSAAATRAAVTAAKHVAASALLQRALRVGKLRPHSPEVTLNGGGAGLSLGDRGL